MIAYFLFLAIFIAYSTLIIEKRKRLSNIWFQTIKIRSCIWAFNLMKHPFYSYEMLKHTKFCLHYCVGMLSTQLSYFHSMTYFLLLRMIRDAKNKSNSFYHFQYLSHYIDTWAILGMQKIQIKNIFIPIYIFLILIDWFLP